MTLSTNNNTSVLPFYKSAKEQDYKKSYAFGHTYHLATPIDRILPFQIIRPHNDNTVMSAMLYKKGRPSPVRSILQELQETGLQVIPFVQYGYDVIVYPGTLPLFINMPEGQYYIRLQDGGYNTWYSDIFTTTSNLSNYIKIEWWDVEDLIFKNGRIVYRSPTFKNTLYLCAEIGKPDYDFKEIGEQRDGYFFPEKQISEKTYKSVAIVPEYLCDVMRLIRMADYIKVTDLKNEKVYCCDTFLITPKWQAQGNLASVDIEFQTATVVKKIGKGYSSGVGDFDKDDYSLDYNINK